MSEIGEQHPLPPVSFLGRKEGVIPKVYGSELLVDERYQAYEMERLPLSALSLDGNQVYAQTNSGNVYEIYVPKREDGEVEFAIMGLRGNEGKGKEAMGSYLTQQDMDLGVLELGRPLRYGLGNTSNISKITYLTGKTGTRTNNPPKSNVRSEFWGKVNKK